MTTHLPKLALLSGAALLAVACIAGCELISYPVAALGPTPKTPAVYELPENATVLVFPDDLTSPVSYPPLKRMVAQQTSELLTANEAAAETVSYRSLQDLQARQPEFNTRPTPIDEVGQAMGADVVIFINFTEFSLKDDPYNPLWHGRLVALVRVVDTDTGQTLWPELQAQGQEIIVETDPEEQSASDYGSELSERLAEMLARKVAELFYEHEGPGVLDQPRYE